MKPDPFDTLSQLVSCLHRKVGPKPMVEYQGVLSRWLCRMLQPSETDSTDCPVVQ